MTNQIFFQILVLSLKFCGMQPWITTHEHKKQLLCWPVYSLKTTGLLLRSRPKNMSGPVHDIFIVKQLSSWHIFNAWAPFY